MNRTDLTFQPSRQTSQLQVASDIGQGCSSWLGHVDSEAEANQGVDFHVLGRPGEQRLRPDTTANERVTQGSVAMIRERQGGSADEMLQQWLACGRLKRPCVFGMSWPTEKLGACCPGEQCRIGFECTCRALSLRDSRRAKRIGWTRGTDKNCYGCGAEARGWPKSAAPARGLEWLDVALLDVLDSSAGRREFPVIRGIQWQPGKGGQPRFAIRVVGMALPGACWAPGHGFGRPMAPGGLPRTPSGRLSSLTRSRPI